MINVRVSQIHDDVFYGAIILVRWSIFFAQPPLRCMSLTAELCCCKPQAIRYFKRLDDWSELKPASHKSHSCFQL